MVSVELRLRTSGKCYVFVRGRAKILLALPCLKTSRDFCPLAYFDCVLDEVKKELKPISYQILRPEVLKSLRAAGPEHARWKGLLTWIKTYGYKKFKDKKGSTLFGLEGTLPTGTKDGLEFSDEWPADDPQSAQLIGGCVRA